MDPQTVGAYVRIHGPRLWIEICVQTGVVLSGAHFHSIERDTEDGLWRGHVASRLSRPRSCCCTSAAAGAHPMPTSAVLLDIGSGKVGGEIVLPLDRLAVALDRPLTPAQAVGPLRSQLERYTRSHIRATGSGGRPWSVAVGGAHVDRNDLVMSLTLTPPDGKVTDFDLRYDVIIDRLVTHKAIATIRTQWSKGMSVHRPKTLGVFDWSTKSLRVDADGGSWLEGSWRRSGSGCSTSARAPTTCCSC